jgi:hypothetical protein
MEQALVGNLARSFKTMRTLGDAKFEDILSCYHRENVGSKSLAWAADQLRAADKNGASRWTLVMLPREEILNITLPHHRHCGVELIPESGLAVAVAAEKTKGRTAETGECWNNIASHRNRDFSQLHIFLKAENGGLKHLDGLHRLLAWVIFDKQVELQAYVVEVG